jgi:hypothetical protein
VGPIRLVVLAMGSGVAFGLAIVSATVLGVDLLRPESPSPTPELGAPLYLLFFGTMAGVVLAAVVAWRVLDPILSIYRRGGLSMVSGLAIIPVMLVCIPVRELAGRSGLGALGVGALLLSLLLARLVRSAEAV